MPRMASGGPSLTLAQVDAAARRMIGTGDRVFMQATCRAAGLSWDNIASSGKRSKQEQRRSMRDIWERSDKKPRKGEVVGRWMKGEMDGAVSRQALSKNFGDTAPASLNTRKARSPLLLARDDPRGINYYLVLYSTILYINLTPACFVFFAVAPWALLMPVA